MNPDFLMAALILVGNVELAIIIARLGQLINKK